MQTAIQLMGIIIALSFIIKCFLHYILAKKNGREISYPGGVASPEYFWFYRKPVSTETKKLKRLCNILFTIFFFLLIIVIFLTRSFLK